MSGSHTDTIVVNGLEANLADRLRARATSNHRTVEAEVRAILTDALAPSSAASNLADAIRRRFAPFGGVDLEAHPPVAVRPPPPSER